MELNSEIRQRLVFLKPVELDIVDDSHAHSGHPGALESGGGHFNIRIVTTAFHNKNRIDRHRLVYDCLIDLMPHKIHALSVIALTPEENHQAN